MKKCKILLMAVLTILALAGCNQNSADSTEKKTVTVTTSFLQDMVKQLAGDEVQIELIIPAGEDPHLYVAKSEDLEKLKKADLLLYHGMHFEGKMVEALESEGIAVSRDFTEAEVGLMEEDGEEVIDPHFWFDIDLYKKAVMTAAEELETLLPEKKDVIDSNEQDYLQKLTELDEYNKEQIATIPEGSRYLITPHDAFNYFSREYGVEVVAPQGVSTDSEVSNTDIADTVDFIVEHDIKAIFAESTTDPARMEKIKEAVEAEGKTVTVVKGDGQYLFSDSLAPVGETGDTYIDMYKHNIELMVKYMK